MKKAIMLLIVAGIMGAGMPVQAEAKTPVSTIGIPAEEEYAALISRLNEIKEMDTENLSKAEKRELRKEVKSIKKTLDGSGGIYISVGALIIIIILLIILL